MSTFSSRTSSQPPNFGSQSQSQPRLSYYITRANGTFVPLIPADELPFNVRLQGVPRILNSDQVFGLQQVTMLPYTGLIFKLENEVMTHQRSSSQPPGNAHARPHSTTDSKHFHLSDSLARQSLGSCNTQGQVAGPSRPVPMHELATNWRKAPTSDPQAVIDAIVGTKSGAEAAAQIGYLPKSNEAPPPSGNVPDQEKKEYCTYWIRHGECDYIQQGCLYKHEMPDKATLQKIGFRSTPRWWLEKTQTVRLGCERATVGPIVKSSVWLKNTGAGYLDSDASGSETSDAESTSAKSTPKRREVETKSADTSSGSTPTEPPATWRSSTHETKERKQSAVSDLIDFKPLLPTPPSSEPSSGTTSLSDDSAHTSLCTPTHLGIQFQDEGKPKKFKTKVFVPPGEATEVHVAEAEKKAAHNQKNHPRAYSKRTASPPEKQIHQVQKSKRIIGLMASKHAPSISEEPKAMEQSASVRKRSPKTGCRVRRPVSSTSATAPGPESNEN